MVVQAKSPWKVYLLQRPITHSKSNTAALEIICSCRLQYRFPLMVGSLKRILYINKNDNVEIGAPHNDLFCLSQLCVFQLCSFECHCSRLSGQVRQVVVVSIAEEGDTGPRGGQSLISCSGRCWSRVTRLGGLHPKPQLFPHSCCFSWVETTHGLTHLLRISVSDTHRELFSPCYWISNPATLVDSILKFYHAFSKQPQDL